jgi:hypothetical protein
MTATAGQPLKRLRGLQAAAHERRSAALAAAIHEGLLQEDVLDFTPTAILMDVDLVRPLMQVLGSKPRRGNRSERSWQKTARVRNKLLGKL